MVVDMSDNASLSEKEIEMSDDLTRMCSIDDVEEGSVLQVSPPGTFSDFAIYKVDGEIYITDDQCTHATQGVVSLAHGEVEDGRIFCPLHGGAFDIRTGAAAELPCRIPIRTYEAVIIGEEIFADLN